MIKNPLEMTKTPSASCRFQLGTVAPIMLSIPAAPSQSRPLLLCPLLQGLLPVTPFSSQGDISENVNWIILPPCLKHSDGFPSCVAAFQVIWKSEEI